MRIIEGHPIPGVQQTRTVIHLSPFPARQLPLGFPTLFHQQSTKILQQSSIKVLASNQLIRKISCLKLAQVLQVTQFNQPTLTSFHLSLSYAKHKFPNREVIQRENATRFLNVLSSSRHLAMLRIATQLFILVIKMMFPSLSYINHWNHSHLSLLRCNILIKPWTVKTRFNLLYLLPLSPIRSFTQLNPNFPQAIIQAILLTRGPPLKWCHDIFYSKMLLNKALSHFTAVLISFGPGWGSSKAAFQIWVFLLYKPFKS